MTDLSDIVSCVSIKTSDNKIIKFAKLDLLRESLYFKNLLLEKKSQFYSVHISKYDSSFWNTFKSYIKFKCNHNLKNFDPMTIFFEQNNIHGFINDYQMENFLKYMTTNETYHFK
jgi:hypothetical protein